MNWERAKVLRTENNTPPALHRGDDSETSQHNHDPPFPHLELRAKGRGRSRPVLSGRVNSAPVKTSAVLHTSLTTSDEAYRRNVSGMFY